MSNNIYAEWTKGSVSSNQLNEVGQWKFNRNVGIGKIWLRVSAGSATVQFKDRAGTAIGDATTVTVTSDAGVYVKSGGADTAFFLFGDVIADVTALDVGTVLFAEVHA